MDISKLRVDLPVEKFYNTYVETLRKLYEENFIVKNNLMPETQESFGRAMAKRADISVDNRNTKEYTAKDLRAIVDDINAKYEEYSSESYSANIRTKGKARYILLSTVLKETFNQLGYEDLAKELKYAEKNVIAAESVVASAALQQKEEEDQKSMKSNVELLESALTIANKTVTAYNTVDLSNKDKEKLKKLLVTLQDITNQCAGGLSGKEDTDDIRNLISQSDKLTERIQDMITGKQVKENTPAVISAKEVTAEDIVKALEDVSAMISAFATAKAKEADNLGNRIDDLSNKLSDLEKKTVLPDDDEELINLAKTIINKISDTTKLKDIGLLIMMKALQ